MKRLDLLESEQGFICFDVCPPISSVTFFEGSPPIEYLRSKTREIVEANPSLCSKPSKKGGIKFMVYPEHKADLPDLFQSFDGNSDDGNSFKGIDLSKSYEEICAASIPLMCKKGRDVTEEDRGSFLVSAVSNQTGNKKSFALVVSMSHVVGDGHTFYSIHNMLSVNATVEALDPKRDGLFLERQKERMGEPMSRGLTDTPLVLRSLMGIIKLKVYTKTLVRQLFYVDEDYVNDKKKNYREQQRTSNGDTEEAAAAAVAAKYVSTNDILTSWFYSLINSKYALMAINLRNRIQGITDKHAGNYMSFIVYQHDDYQDPELIRKAVSSCGKEKAYPGVWQRLWASPYGIVSNWSTFDKGIDLPGGEGNNNINNNKKQVLHLPLYNEDGLQADASMCIIFRATRDKLAMLFISDRGLPEHGGAAGGSPLGKALHFGAG